MLLIGGNIGKLDDTAIEIRRCQRPQSSDDAQFLQISFLSFRLRRYLSFRAGSGEISCTVTLSDYGISTGYLDAS